MKKTIVALATIACLPAFAHAETNGFYLGGQLGASILKANSLKDTVSYADGSKSYKIGSFNKGKIAGALNLGYNFKYDCDLPIRTELSYTVRSNLDKKNNRSFSDVIFYDDLLRTSDRHKVRMNTLMFNGYYDIETGRSVTPFVGAGLGVAFAKLEQKYSAQYKLNYKKEDNDVTGFVSMSKSKTKFAWNVAAGIAYNIEENIDIDFTARYVNAGKLSTKTNIWEVNKKASTKLSSVDLLAGLRYTF